MAFDLLGKDLSKSQFIDCNKLINTKYNNIIYESGTVRGAYLLKSFIQ